MSILSAAVEDSRSIWDACLETPFVQGLAEGSLPDEVFYGYIVQDSVYLKHYAKVYAKAVCLAETLRDMRVYYSMMGFVTQSESAVRIRYLNDAGLTDDDVEGISPLPENLAYLEFLAAEAQTGNERRILMAALPCMLSYCYVFRRIVEDRILRDNPYADFIADYACDGYLAECTAWGRFAEGKLEGADRREIAGLREIFRAASRHELNFWRMAGNITRKVTAL